MLIKNSLKKLLVMFVCLVVISVFNYGEKKFTKNDLEWLRMKEKMTGKEKRNKERRMRKGPLVITYDYLVGKFSTDIKDKKGLSRYVVWFRQNVTLKVINVNPFLFKTTITGDGYNYFTESPKAFSDIYKEGMGIKEKVKSSTEVKGGAKEAKNNIEKNNKDELKYKPGSTKTQLIGIVDSMFEKINIFIKSYGELTKIIKFSDSLTKILFREKPYSELKSNLEKHMISFWGANIKADLLQSEFYKMIEDAKNKFKKVDFKFLEQEKCKGVKGIDKLITQLKDCKKSLDNLEKGELIPNIFRLLNKFQKENFERSLLIPTVELDEVQFKVLIESLDKEKYVTRNIVNNPISIRVKRGWVINFSTGILFHLNAHDRSYTLVPVDVDQGKAIIKENENKNSITPSITALMHVYPRSVRSVKWGGITFGVGTNDTERINYYIGTSYMFGFKKRFVINGGMTITKINILKPKFELGEEVDVGSDLTSDELVHREFELRFFIGFTYNLTK